MSEWLTTGAMIDRLKVGEVVECINPPQRIKKYSPEELRVTKNEQGFLWIDGLGFRITKEVAELKWRILPKYVTFEEAMQALKDDKTVTYHDEHKEGYTFDLEKHWNLDEVADYTMEDLFKERWTIEG